MARCKFQLVDGWMICEWCDRKLPAVLGVDVNKYWATCLVATVESANNLPNEFCPYFLGVTKETIKAFGCGCPSEKSTGVEVTVCGCELESHPRCTLFNKGELSDLTVVRCSQCLDNPNKRAKQ
jgi:hypothetical protein